MGVTVPTIRLGVSARRGLRTRRAGAFTETFSATITIANAAAPEASLSFLFFGAGIVMMPVIAIYTLRKYWIFRGKATKLH